jgi:putative peptidoglycan lipid II flippase
MWYQLPYGVLAVAYFTALFPEMADQAVGRMWPQFKSTVSRGLRVMGLLILPMSAMLVSLASPLVTLYQHGSFTAKAVPVVVPLVQLWGVGLFSYAAFMIILRAFYAQQDSRTPAIVNLVLTAGQIGLYWYFTRPGMLGLPGIPLADGIFFTAMDIVLLWILRRRRGALGLGAVAWSAIRVAFAAAIGGVAAYFVSQALIGLGTGIVASFTQAIAGGVVGLTLSYSLAALMRVDEMHDAIALVRRIGGRLAAGRAS